MDIWLVHSHKDICAHPLTQYGVKLRPEDIRRGFAVISFEWAHRRGDSGNWLLNTPRRAWITVYQGETELFSVPSRRENNSRRYSFLLENCDELWETFFHMQFATLAAAA